MNTTNQDSKTQLQNAIERLEHEISLQEGSGDQFCQDLNSILSAAKQFSVVQAENEELKNKFDDMIHLRDFAIHARDTLQAELKQEKIWKVEDPRMLREQMRVHDVAFQHLFEQNKSLTLSLESLTKENEWMREALKEIKSELCSAFIRCLNCGHKEQLDDLDVIKTIDEALSTQPTTAEKKGDL